ncbi:histidine kinase [Mariniluteicoccus endophyticus]
MPTLSLRHALHVSVVVLVVLGVVRAWQDAALPHGTTRAWVATVLAVALVLGYVAGQLLEPRATARMRLVWVSTLVACWVAGSAMTEGFLWVAFPLFFLVLSVVPGRWGVAAVGSMVVWSVVAALVRARLDGAARGLPVGMWLGPLLGALSAVGAYAVFGQLRRDAERNRALVAELRAAQDELAAAERARGVLAERERLAREIHDTIAQGLGSIVLLARTARTTDDVAGALAGIEATARENLVDARRLVRDLGTGNPSLTDALQRLVTDTAVRQDALHRPLEVSLRVDGPARHLDERRITALHRGAQASIANVVQHAGASRCVLSLTWWPAHVTLDIADDGRGFDTSAPAGTDSFGLTGLRRRLAEVGGTMEVDSSPGEGTTVSLSVPLEEER